ncbi:MAG: carboxypeptidase-like regulatory domain-containing protein [Planctomycetota bacterium]|nr:carboxypeptidase-like regulatory domain-containing protein [Planctomycetota bacterium]
MYHLERQRDVTGVGKKTFALALGVLALLSVAVTLFRGDGSREKRGEASRPRMLGRDAQKEVKVGALAADAETPVPSLSLPSPVDFADVDRNRDLFGIVVDEENGTIAGADIRSFQFESVPRFPLDEWQRVRDTPGPRTQSSRDGSFSLRLQRDLIVDLHVTAEGFAKTVVSMANAGEKLRVVLPRPGRLELTVVDQSREGVGRAEIGLSFRHAFEMVPRYEHTGVTNESGRLVLEDLPPGPAMLTIGHNSWNWVYTEWLILETGASTVREIRIPLDERLVRGKVVDGLTGAPIPGAAVGIGLKLSHRVVADERGRYHFTGIIGEEYYTLTATAEGYAPQSRPVPHETDLDFALKRGGTAVGIVVDSNMAPLKDVLISVFGMDWVDGLREMDMAKVISEEDGAFSFAGLNSNLTKTFVFWKPGYGRKFIRLADVHRVAMELDLGTVVLHSPLRIQGRALRDDGTPLVRAMVTISKDLSAESEERERGSGFIVQETLDERVTDDLGRFHFVDLDEGAYLVQIDAPGREPIVERVLLRSGQDFVDVEIRIPSGRSIRVRVEDEIGQPIPRVPILTSYSPQIFRSGDRPARNLIETNESGIALLEGLAEETITLLARMETGYMSPPSRSVVPKGQEILFVLKRASEIRGVVKDPNGRPLESLVVEGIIGRDGETPFGGRHSGLPGLDVLTDADGLFVLNCPQGAVVDILVSGSLPGEDGVFYDWEGVVKGISTPARDVVVHARASGLVTLSVLVLGPWGGAVEGVSVTVVSADSGKFLQSTVTDSDGEAELRVLGGSNVWVTAHAPPGDGSLKEVLGDVRKEVITIGKQRVDLQFVEAIVIEGIVLNTLGRRVERVMVRALSGQITAASSKTDQNGRFRLRVADDGPYEIEARQFDDTGRVIESGSVIDVTAPSEDVTVTIREGG